MSRLGKKPILIPEGVEVNINSRKVTVKGPKGELSKEIRPEIKIEKKERQLYVSPLENVRSKKIKAYLGLTKRLIENMVKGVVENYEKKLQIIGVGYKGIIEGEKLVIWAGFTHPVPVLIPKSIKVAVEKDIIIISGPDKELVGQLASKIRKIQPPEPYKGKGIRYLDEVVRRKEGKKVTTTQ